ncbi:hypothetical protein HAX54_011856, partial [Datura stramonium]|nr:hypothetical protein [Datura stramonium]
TPKKTMHDTIGVYAYADIVSFKEPPVLQPDSPKILYDTIIVYPIIYAYGGIVSFKEPPVLQPGSPKIL